MFRFPLKEEDGWGGFSRLEPRSAAGGRSQDNARFVAILAPDESWSAFDCIAECPAELNGQCLIGLSREGATATAKRLNDRLRRFGGWETAR